MEFMVNHTKVWEDRPSHSIIFLLAFDSLRCGPCGASGSGRTSSSTRDTGATLRFTRTGTRLGLTTSSGELLWLGRATTTTIA